MECGWVRDTKIPTASFICNCWGCLQNDVIWKMCLFPAEVIYHMQTLKVFSGKSQKKSVFSALSWWLGVSLSVCSASAHGWVMCCSGTLWNSPICLSRRDEQICPLVTGGNISFLRLPLRALLRVSESQGLWHNVDILDCGLWGRQSILLWPVPLLSGKTAWRVGVFSTPSSFFPIVSVCGVGPELCAMNVLR